MAEGIIAAGDGSFVRLVISGGLSASKFENRFPSSITIRELKAKLELVTGATASLSELQLFDTEGKLLCGLDNEDATLSSYPVENGFRVHVINHDSTKVAGEYDDVSRVDKFEISKDEYSKREDSVLAYKRRMKLGQFAEKDPEAVRQAAEKEQQEKEMAEAITVGSRCEVVLPGAAPKRGTVMFTGVTKFKSGYFVGVKYDEPLGKNDGSVDGVRYFQCPPKYGGFVKPQHVKVGEFPEETFSDDEM